MNIAERGMPVYRLILAPLAGFAIGLAAGLLLGGGDSAAPAVVETATPATSVPTIQPTVVIVPTPAPTVPPPSPTPETHVVQPGDTLTAIAAQYDTTIEILLELNELHSADQLEVGQILILP